MIFRKGTIADVTPLAKLYDDLIDHLQNTTNYPGWIKGIYPTQEDAAAGISDGTLYVAEENGQLAGTIILNHKPESPYHRIKWNIDAADEQIFIVHTFAVHPNFLKAGVGTKLLGFAEKQAVQEGLRAIRLDVFEKNFPAIHLYEKCDFQYVSTVDMGLGCYGLDLFKLYEKVLPMP